jgi:hypothetical protein
MSSRKRKRNRSRVAKQRKASGYGRGPKDATHHY